MSGEPGSIHKGPTRWQRGQHDFSGGPVKRTSVHSLKLAEPKEYRRLCRKIILNGVLASIVRSPESRRLSTAKGLAAAKARTFSVEQVAASMDVQLQLPIAGLQQAVEQHRPQQDEQEQPEQGAGPSSQQTRSMNTAAAGPSGKSAVALKSPTASPVRKKQRAAGTSHQQAPPPALANSAAGLAPAWLPHIPDLPESSWALKCIRRWGLQPPFDSAATDEQWHLYHDERRALELVHQACEREAAKPLKKRISDMNNGKFADSIN
uniref:Uncharacterized protein n=1 Tax=Dunaliella tertiolecta TaxID=3047 RepID=A0A7S3VLX0_DUNTE|mmetsp:Transcript_26523/g.71741  ORF Transcript_26523/g.71741 Transcript_26523/m.71741 type:complete len:264 (-) Transcript_26523:1208-1999(-)